VKGNHDRGGEELPEWFGKFIFDEELDEHSQELSRLRAVRHVPKQLPRPTVFVRGSFLGHSLDKIRSDLDQDWDKNSLVLGGRQRHVGVRVCRGELG